MEMEGEPSAILPLPVLVHDLGTRAEDSQTQYSISSQASSAAAGGVMRDHRCFETPQGWVLALDPASLQTFLFRPQDGERVRLPPLEEALPLRCKCLLSDSPTAKPGCAVVVVFDLDDSKMWTCSIGAASRWDSYRYQLTVFLDGDVPRDKNMAKCHGMAAVGGKIYYEMTGDELGFIRFNDDDGSPELDAIAVDMVDLPLSMPTAATYLVESCGDLFLVVIFFDGDNVHKIAEHAVYRMDFSKPAWRKVDSIGDDRAFLTLLVEIGLGSPVSGRRAPLLITLVVVVCEATAYIF
ncbi:uncharacterized protein LOC125527694 [Triticum urartu]|uniref:KIB1-4 beta-propeller domain-containing protein n=1 Tax=Triticum urartu TaxID=4572 RepID=A0A8R7RC43_TRIUA|nr:uncharacterized protein LOC125527694 [Triticum urartu]